MLMELTSSRLDDFKKPLPKLHAMDKKKHTIIKKPTRNVNFSSNLPTLKDAAKHFAKIEDLEEEISSMEKLISDQQEIIEKQIKTVSTQAQIISNQSLRIVELTNLLKKNGVSF